MSDFDLGGLSLEIDGYEFPDDEDYWDGNWLEIRATLTAPDARVDASGPFLRTDELECFAQDLETLQRTLEGGADLDTMEPQLKLSMQADGLGHLHLTIELTPDTRTQVHRVEVELDQTYIEPALKALRSILERYPVRGERP